VLSSDTIEELKSFFWADMVINDYRCEFLNVFMLLVFPLTMEVELEPIE
jgi:hypothetical protein